jgi:hypothetical protein
MKYSKTTGCFYPEEIQYSALPTDLIEVTKAEHREALSRGPSETLDVVDGKLVIVPAPTQTPEQALQSAKAAAIAAINAVAQAALEQITSAYPAGEVTTWEQQYAEALAYQASNAAPTPMLSAIVSAYPGQTLAAQAASVLAKAAAYKLVSGAVVGKRQALTDQVRLATTVDAVQSIHW